MKNPVNPLLLDVKNKEINLGCKLKFTCSYATSDIQDKSCIGFASNEPRGISFVNGEYNIPIKDIPSFLLEIVP